MIMESRTLPATFEERMRIATISDRTRDYLVIYGRLEDIWGEVDRLLERDYAGDNVKRSNDFGELMADVVNKIKDYVTESITGNLGLADCVRI